MSIFSASRRRYQPITIYLFRTGTEEEAFYAYTDSETPVTVDGITYQPLAIQHGKIKTKGDLEKVELTVEMPVSAEFADRFRVFPPSFSTSLVIREGDRNDLSKTFLAIWTGRVLAVSRTGKNEAQRAVVSCESSQTSIRKIGLRRHFQLTCPHLLYGDKCRADSESKTFLDVTPVDVGAASLLLDVGWNGAFEPVKFQTGEAFWQGQLGVERRMILAVTEDPEEPGRHRLSLSGPTTDLTGTVSYRVGCNHTLEECIALHANAVNYGGFPFIPLENPVNKNPYW